MESRDVFVAACLLFVLVMVGLKLRYGPGSGRRNKAPAPEIRSGRIITEGWSHADARRIVADFAKLYDLDAATFAVSDAGDALQVTWKRPITAATALYLVNYLTYPANVAAGATPAAAVGVIPVPADTAPAGVTAGTLAKIFVPQGDTEHDLVHALLADGRAYRISFARMIWEAVPAPRAPSLAERTAFKDVA